MSQQEAQATPKAVTSTILVGPSSARVIFDSGATHSFVATRYAITKGMLVEVLSYCVVVSTPLEERLETTKYVKNCEIVVNDVNLPIDLILLDMLQMDAI